MGIERKKPATAGILAIAMLSCALCFASPNAYAAPSGGEPVGAAELAAASAPSAADAADEASAPALAGETDEASAPVEVALAPEAAVEAAEAPVTGQVDAAPEAAGADAEASAPADAAEAGEAAAAAAGAASAAADEQPAQAAQDSPVAVSAAPAAQDAEAAEPAAHGSPVAEPAAQASVPPAQSAKVSPEVLTQLAASGSSQDPAAAPAALLVAAKQSSFEAAPQEQVAGAAHAGARSSQDAAAAASATGTASAGTIGEDSPADLVATVEVDLTKEPVNTRSPQVNKPRLDTETWGRLWGQDALGTMAEVVGVGWERAPIVVLASNSGYWDALTASSLAGFYDAPILLTDPWQLSAQTAELLQSLGTMQVFVCGGEMSVSSEVLRQIEQRGITNIIRLAGEDCQGTAREIASYVLTVRGVSSEAATPASGAQTDSSQAAQGSAQAGQNQAGQNAGTAGAAPAAAWNDDALSCVVATSYTYQDALSIAPYAYRFQTPIFMSNPDGLALDRETIELISQTGFGQALLVGGMISLAPSIETQLASAGVGLVTRVAGESCYETSQAVAEWELERGMKVDNMGVATGTTYHDALTGAALCGKNDAVLLLADGTSRQAAEGFVSPRVEEISQGYIFGGKQSVDDVVHVHLENGEAGAVYDNLVGYDLTGHTKVGLDVSVHQGPVDWKQVAESGVEFVILRLGYGNNARNQDDARFASYLKGCQENGIPVGVYIYSYAYSTAEAASEARHTLRVLQESGLKPEDVPFGVWFDLEEPYLQQLADKDLLLSMSMVYCEEIRKAGYTPGIYANLNWNNNLLTSPFYNQWDRWIAQYAKACDYQGEYVMWQCMGTGVVPDIPYNTVDVNLYYL